MELSIQPLDIRYETVPMDLLLEADPSEDLILAYLPLSFVFKALLHNELVGIMLLTPMDSQQLEIKNIAVHQDFRQRGIGKRLLQFAQQFAKDEGFEALWIGTANSSVEQWGLYQKMGFELNSVRFDFFTQHYPVEIWENGIQAKHLMMLSKPIH